MSVTFIFCVAAVGCLATLASQWVLLRSRYLKGLAEQRARHQQQQQAVQVQLEVAKQQIARLQRDLSARLQTLRQASKEHTSAAPRALNNPVASAPPLPVDGFADTLPTP
jgi:heme exporter protein D